MSVTQSHDLPWILCLQLLKDYYTRIFPYKKYFDWLSYAHEGFNATGSRGQLPYREFSFTIEDDIYIRHLSFDTLKDLRMNLIKRNPIKIDLGAEYEDKPDKNRSTILEAKRRELVFDIDMTDYDPVRFCCQGAKVCEKCWPFMKIAVKIINTALREDFDFHHTLWVFSGRRGIHCWVCDKTARTLNSVVRKSIGEYFSLVTQLDKKKLWLFRRVNVHPVVARACTIIDQYFPTLCIEDQDILGDDTRVEKFLQFIPDEAFKQQLIKDFAKHTTSKDRWNAFLSLYDTFSVKGMLKYNMIQIRELIKINYAYPRLDLNVTKGFKHLLKSPFCAHPKTLQVCVPFNPKAVDTFDPFKVPTLEQLSEELALYDYKVKAQTDVPDSNLPDKPEKDSEDAEYGRKTSLIKSLHVFDIFLSKLKTYNGGPPPQ